MNHKQIAINYSPSDCPDGSCKRAQYLSIVGEKIIAYFSDMGVPQLIASPPKDVGFEYIMDSTVDALTDAGDIAGLRYALSQLSPGSRYLKYLMSASQVGDVLTLVDRVDVNVPPIGLIRTETTISVSIDQCKSCLASITLITTDKNNSQSSFSIGIDSCELSELQ